MTEIDFLPQWYQAGRSRRMWYRRQVLILSMTALFAAAWCFVAGQSLSRVRAQLNTAQSNFESEIGKIQRYEELSGRYFQLQSRVNILNSIMPRTSYASVLAELSCCIGPDVVLRKLDIHGEPVDSGKPGAVPDTAGKPKKINLAAGSNKSLSRPETTQTCIVITGYAADAKLVAGLISSLEQSAYFCRVVPVYSKNRTVQGRDVAEFEIRCILADFEVLNGKG